MKKTFPPIFTKIVTLVALAITVIGAIGQENPKDVDLTSRPGTEESRTQAMVSFRVLNVEEIDGATQSFTANVAIMVEWKDDRLAGASDIRTMKLDNIWHPMIQIANQQRLVETFPKVAKVSPDGTVLWIQRYWGKFSNPLALQDFPIDKHTFSIKVVGAADQDYTDFLVSEEGENRSGMADELSLPDWKVTGWNVTADRLELIEGGESMPLAVFSFDAHRYIGYYLTKVLVPLLMIVMMSWIVFWIHPSEAGSQISVSVTSMLTLIAYRFALGAMLPKVSYVTRMDAFILFASIMVFVALMEAVLTSRLVKMGNEELALKIDRKCRVLFPCAFVIVALLAAFS